MLKLPTGTKVLEEHGLRITDSRKPPSCGINDLQVEWRQAPRPLTEFLQPSRFTLPRSQKKWSARVKNSAYYYRWGPLTNLKIVQHERQHVLPQNE